MIAFAPVRTAGPAAPLLSLEDAKAHLKVEHSAEDALITALIGAAEGWLDGWAGVLGQALVTQTWRQSFDGFPDENRLRLPLGPMQAVVEITYIDRDGVQQTYVTFGAASDAIGPVVVRADGASWPATATRPDAVTVTWTCGFGGTASAVPQAIVQAAKLLVGHWHANREAVSRTAMSEVPMAVGALIAPYRVSRT